RSSCATAGHATHQTNRPKPVARGRVLLAEDNEINQIVVKAMLGNVGFVCEVVDDGLQAVEASGDSHFDLIIMDCQMPGMDGYGRSGRIRERELGLSRPRIPIIALTANAGLGDRQQCLDAGMDEYCSKPIDSARLYAVVDRVLAKLGDTFGRC